MIVAIFFSFLPPLMILVPTFNADVIVIPDVPSPIGTTDMLMFSPHDQRLAPILADNVRVVGDALSTLILLNVLMESCSAWNVSSANMAPVSAGAGL